jgi:hypothetical protein
MPEPFKRTYPINTHRRTGTLTLEERHDCVIASLEFSACGDLGDGAEIMAALLPRLARYEDDPRPFQMANPRWGELATIGKVDGVPVAIVEREPRH